MKNAHRAAFENVLMYIIIIRATFSNQNYSTKNDCATQEPDGLKLVMALQQDTLHSHPLFLNRHELVSGQQLRLSAVQQGHQFIFFDVAKRLPVQHGDHFIVLDLAKPAASFPVT